MAAIGLNLYEVLNISESEFLLQMHSFLACTGIFPSEAIVSVYSSFTRFVSRKLVIGNR